MSQQISRYPLASPRAEFINHDDPDVRGTGERTNFIVSGKEFDPQMKASFWDSVNNREVTDVNIRPAEGGDGNSIEGSVALPGPGNYQLVLQNPGCPKHAQPAWIHAL